MPQFKSVHWLQALLLLAMAMVASSAMAAGNSINLGKYEVWTVYGFGNAQAVKDTFRALANFANSGLLQAAFSTMAVIGVLVVGLTSGFQMGGGRKFIGYLVGVFLLSYVMFGPTNGGPLTVMIDVVDTVETTPDGAPVWKAPVSVPAVIGIPAALISMAGFEMTQAIEASFNINDAFKLSKGAPFNLPGALLSDASQARISDPNLASSMSYYVQDCFTIGVAQGALQASTLINSTNFIQDIQYNNNSVMVNTLLNDKGGPSKNLNLVGTPDLVTCAEAWTLINAAVNAQGGSAASGYLRNASAWSRTPALSVVNAGADALAQYVSNNGITNGGSLVKQSAVLSAFRDAHSQAAIQTGNSEFLTGIAMAQATEAQRTSWITGAEIFNKTMGYIFAILQVFVYSVSSLVLFAIVIPGLGLALMKNFAQILLWLALWQPMLAIVNFVVLSLQQSELTSLMSNGTDSYGFTLSNMGIVSEKSANFRAAATFVGTMVPALAWGLVKGSLDFSRVIGSAMGENFAQGAANTMTTGNYSLNQASMDSFTSNKHSTAATGAWGYGNSTNSATGAKTNDLGGNQGEQVGDEKLGIAVSSNIGANASGTAGKGTNAGITAADQVGASAAYAKSHQAAENSSATRAEAAASGNTLGAQAGVTAGYALYKPNAGSPRGAADAVGGPGAGSAQTKTSEEPARFEKGKTPDRLSVNAGAGITAAVSGSKTLTNSKQDGNVVTDTGSKTETGSRNLSGGKTASEMRNTNVGSGYSEGLNQQARGISSARDRALMRQAYVDNRAGGPLTQGAWGHADTRQSDLGRQVVQLGQAGAVANAVAEKKAEVNSEQAQQAKEAHDLKTAAEKTQGKYVSAAQKEMRENEKEEKAREGAALTPAHKMFTDQMANNGADALIYAIDNAPGLDPQTREAARAYVQSLAPSNNDTPAKVTPEKSDSQPKPESDGKSPPIGTNNSFGIWG